MAPATVKWAELGELIWVAPVAVVLVTVAYAGVVFGAGRAIEAGRAGAGAARVGWLGLAVASGLLFTGAVAFALHVIAS